MKNIKKLVPLLLLVASTSLNAATVAVQTETEPVAKVVEAKTYKTYTGRRVHDKVANRKRVRDEDMTKEQLQAKLNRLKARQAKLESLLATK